MPLAPFACRPESSLGRAVAEPEEALRTPFQRDRDRIIHAVAFRRLEYKTQVFVNFEGDHFRTRLTHSLEVAQIARTFARALAVDEDLAEAIALAHDLGHSPFGHAGERALGEFLERFGGFDHNLQTFRIVTRLEQRYAGFDGLNLTLETLEGLLKHNGPLRQPLSAAIAEHPIAQRLDLTAQAPIEAQLAAIADDVAYCSHDLDDGLRAGFFNVADLARLPLLDDIVTEVREAWPGLNAAREGHEINRRIIACLVADVIAETARGIAEVGPDTLAEIRQVGRPLARFSTPVARAVAALRQFLEARMYRHYKVARMSLKAGRVVRELAQVFMTAPDCLPEHWRERADVAGSSRTAAVVRDYIAGMTDRYALDEHDRLFRLTRDRA